MRCSHVVSIKFRRDHFAAVLHFCNKNHAPKAFTTLFLKAIKDFLQDKSPLQGTPQTNVVNDLIHSQEQIGWHLFMRGFLSTLWERFLQAQILRQLPTDKRLTMEPAAFITGLIKTLWTSMSTLWTNHCNHVHRKDDNGPSPDKLLELQTRVRTLHSRRNDTLAAHRDLYFYEDLEAHLRNATVQELRTYLLNYEPNILASIKRSQDMAGNSLIDFFGFTRTVENSLAPTSIRPGGSGEPPINPKHSRWRTIVRTTSYIRDYFNPDTTDSTDTNDSAPSSPPRRSSSNSLETLEA